MLVWSGWKTTQAEQRRGLRKGAHQRLRQPRCGCTNHSRRGWVSLRPGACQRLVAGHSSPDETNMARCRRTVFHAWRRGRIRRALHGRGNGLGHDVREGRVAAARPAIDGWDPSLPREWTSLHRRLVARRQLLCRGLALVLRHPWLARTGFELAIRASKVAGLMIQRMNTPSILSQTS